MNSISRVLSNVAGMGTMEESGGGDIAGTGLHLMRQLEDNHGKHCQSVDFVALRVSPEPSHLPVQTRTWRRSYTKYKLNQKNLDKKVFPSVQGTQEHAGKM